MRIAASLRRKVIARADGQCEYCGIAQAGQEAVFHIDHVKPLAAGGETKFENLALACVSCSLRKGARQRATDPETGREGSIFDSRSEEWRQHFRWYGVRAVGLTRTGRATVAALEMNRPIAQSIRREESYRNRHPPRPQS